MKKKSIITLLALVLLAAGIASVYAAPRTPCNRCAGQGFLTCPACNGSGKREQGFTKGLDGVSRPNVYPCGTCSGRKVIKCTVCGGKGYQ